MNNEHAPTAAAAEQTRRTSGEVPGEKQIDPARRALAIGLELAKNAARSKTLEELQFILVNDTRALLEFDRSFLLLHLGGQSKLLAANNQPKVEIRAGFVQKVNELAMHLRGVDRGLVLFSAKPATQELPPETAAALEAYMEYSKSSCLMVVPLSAYDNVIGHLMLEYFGDGAPGEVETYTLMNMVPFFSSALAEKWLLHKKPLMRKSLLGGGTGGQGLIERLGFSGKIGLLVGLVVLAIVGLSLPITLTVGGKAELAPDYEYYAFIEMEGIVDKVMTREGDLVKKGQLLAVLDDKEIDYKIREAKRLRESYQAETEILLRLGAENPSKLAESQLVALKIQRARQDLEFLSWQRGFLNIKSPVEGMVLTKKVESLVGKKFKAGEPFCKIAPHRALLVEVFVRESDVAFVKEGQKGEVFLNYEPKTPRNFVVRSIAPMSETSERTGAVFRVKAAFVNPPADSRPGMQGVAHIDTGTAGLWFVVTRRIATKINELLLVF